MAKYIWPVPAWTGINQLFGTFPGGFNPPGGHTGTDYGTPIGTPIRAIADGVVKHADWFRGAYYDNPWLIEPSFAGIVVVIDHGECLSVYAHMNDTPLNPGQRVKQGQIIGHSGNTRNGVDVFGPHLHFEIMPDGWSVNNGTYGRVNPGRYCTEYWGVANETIIRPGQTGTTTTNKPKEDTLSAAEVKEIKNYIHALAIGGYESGGKKHPGFAMVAEENQRRIGRIAKDVWGTKVRRAKGSVSALQELADAKTAAQSTATENAALRSVLDQLAEKQGVAIDYAKVEAAAQAGARRALAQGVDIEATVTLKDTK